jgi:hypothetical protein
MSGLFLESACQLASIVRYIIAEIIYYRITTVLWHLGSGPDAISSVSISKNRFETFARDFLLERIGHTLELYEGRGIELEVVQDRNCLLLLQCFPTLGKMSIRRAWHMLI